MTKKFSAKRIALVVVLACLCAVAAIVPAYAYYYAHNEEHVNASNKGVMEVVCTLDETAVGGGIHTGIVFVAEGATAQDAIDEAVISPLAANEPSAIKDYTAQAKRVPRRQVLYRKCIRRCVAGARNANYQ